MSERIRQRYVRSGVKFEMVNEIRKLQNRTGWTNAKIMRETGIDKPTMEAFFYKTRIDYEVFHKIRDVLLNCLKKDETK